MLDLETSNRPKPRFVDKVALLQQLREADKKIDANPEPGLTSEMLQERIAAKLRARGIDPDTLRYSQDEKS